MRLTRWRIAELTFLVAGLALLDVYIWTQAAAVLSQAQASWVFRSELKKARETPGEPRHLRPEELVGWLEIPRLRLSVMVREGSDTATLAKAAGHLPSTPLPGTLGNVAVAAHRDTFFRPLRNIKVNDRITFTTLQGTFEYQVESLRIVHPTDVSVLRASTEPTLTLVTCYPFYYVGSAPQRFIVRARQVGSPAKLPGAPLALSRPVPGSSLLPGS
jgi:sortase A